METILTSFINVFSLKIKAKDTDGNEEEKKIEKIVIPIIQRDYAQGRKDYTINRTRDRFLDSLVHAVTNEPIVLDFVYGSVVTDDGNNPKSGKNKGTTIFIPLDGQQRLTTLFLLHWYAAKKGNIAPEEYEFLKNFSYETRYSARAFCACLVGFTPDFTSDKSLKEQIIEQAWFPYDWMNDPTISGMLTMLNAIQAKFAEVNNLWEQLKKNTIQFYLLPLENMGLTDDLYIKMNSRGKPLTQFEHFKAELEKNLRTIDANLADKMISKIDGVWTDLIWPYARGNDHIIDNRFLRYFHFVCDIICYQNGGTPQDRKGGYDEFDLIDEYFPQNDKAITGKNAIFLEQMFDIWAILAKNQKDSTQTIREFFEHFLAKQHETGKSKVDFDSKESLDIFKECMDNFGEFYSNNRNRKFPLGKTVLLYAFTTYLLNISSISEEQFIRRLRMVNNLIKNSQYEISDSADRTGGNRMPEILKQVDSIIESGEIDESLGNNFNVNQLSEEQEKLVWTKDNPSLQESLYELEDHELLYGQIGIVGLDDPSRFGRFISLFNCSWDKVDKALMATGDYSQLQEDNWRYQSGSRKNTSAWQTLFHKSRAKGNTKDILKQLLQNEDFSDDILDQITRKFLKECENNNAYNWRYYYVKYKCFRPGRFGIYWWRRNNKKEDGPYDFKAFWAPRQASINAYQVFIKALARELDLDTDPDTWGNTIALNENKCVSADNAGFYIQNKDNEDDIIAELQITMENGIDTEERIVAAKEWLQSNFSELIPKK